MHRISFSVSDEEKAAIQLCARMEGFRTPNYVHFLLLEHTSRKLKNKNNENIEEDDYEITRGVEKRRIQLTIPENEYYRMKAYAEKRTRTLSNFALLAMRSELRKHTNGLKNRKGIVEIDHNNHSEVNQETISVLIDEIKQLKVNTYVYFVQDCSSKYIKIGYSQSVENRIKGMETDNPHNLELLAVIPGTRKTEKVIHEMLREHNHRSEWFYPEEPVMKLIKAINDELLS